MSQLQLLATGKLEAGCREIMAVSLLQPRRDVVEHCVNWHDGSWIAEVRVNMRLTARTKFEGQESYAKAIAWCEAVAPQAEIIPTPYIDMVEAASDVDALIEEMFAKPGLDYAPTSVYAPEGEPDWAGFINHAAELEDLEEDMLDRDDRARGGW